MFDAIILKKITIAIIFYEQVHRVGDGRKHHGYHIWTFEKGEEGFLKNKMHVFRVFKLTKTFYPKLIFLNYLSISK